MDEFVFDLQRFAYDDADDMADDYWDDADDVDDSWDDTDDWSDDADDADDAESGNYEDNILLKGTDNADYISNYGKNVTIDGGRR